MELNGFERTDFFKFKISITQHNREKKKIGRAQENSHAGRQFEPRLSCLP